MTTITGLNETYNIENVFCIGRNYTEHIKELNHQVDNEILVFLKPNTAISLDGTPVILPKFSNNVHYECEIVILIGQSSTTDEKINPDDFIAGYAIGIDLTARDIQKQESEKGRPWMKSKGFKQSALLSSFIPKEAIKKPDNIHFELKINGETVQVGETTMMLYTIPTIIQNIHQLYGLKKGDIIYTGTPKGVGPLHPNDKLELDLEHGLLTSSFEIKA